MKRYNSKILENFTKNIFLKLNMSNKDALKVSKLIIQSDLYGVNTHGIFRLPNYVKRITEGGMNMNPNIKVIKDQINKISIRDLNLKIFASMMVLKFNKWRYKKINSILELF